MKKLSSYTLVEILITAIASLMIGFGSGGLLAHPFVKMLGY